MCRSQKGQNRSRLFYFTPLTPNSLKGHLFLFKKKREKKRRGGGGRQKRGRGGVGGEGRRVVRAVELSGEEGGDVTWVKG